MIGLKVSKEIYLVFTVFSCIIKYQWFSDKNKVLDKVLNFLISNNLKQK